MAAERVETPVEKGRGGQVSDPPPGLGALQGELWEELGDQVAEAHPLAGHSRHLCGELLRGPPGIFLLLR